MECGSLPAFFNVARSVSTALNKNQLDGAGRGDSPVQNESGHITYINSLYNFLI